jgi:hypothetical protein
MAWRFLRTVVDDETARKLQRQTFRYKRERQQECICLDETSRIGFDHASESSDEHGNAETLDASADTFGTAVRGAGVAVRGSLARPFLLARDTGTTDGVHTRCAQTLQRIHPQCRSDNSLSH